MPSNRPNPPLVSISHHHLSHCTHRQQEGLIQRGVISLRYKILPYKAIHQFLAEKPEDFPDFARVNLQKALQPP